MRKYQHYIDVWGEVLPTPRITTTVVSVTVVSKTARWSVQI